MIKKLQIKKGIASLSLATILCSTTLSGCVKKIDCDKQGEHAHLYTTEDEKFKTYRSGEFSQLPTSHNENTINIYWKEEAIPLTEEIENMEKFCLFKISDNVETLKRREKKDKKKGYQEYQYLSTKYRPKYRYGSYVPTIKYTTDKNHKKLTGMVRDVYYQYQGYKIEYVNGKLNLISSGLVDSLEEIKEEYPYFNLKDYRQKSYSEPYANDKENIRNKQKQKGKK